MSSLHTIIEHEESGNSLDLHFESKHEDLNLTPESVINGQMAAHSSAAENTSITSSKQTAGTMLHMSKDGNMMENTFEALPKTRKKRMSDANKELQTNCTNNDIPKPKKRIKKIQRQPLQSILQPAEHSPVVGPEPIRCALCSPEQLGACPAVSSDCVEVLREPGCGCCFSCALRKGDSCGVYTAHCGTGLRCTPRSGDPRPLYALTRGQAVCTEYDDAEEEPDITDQSSLHHLLGLNRPLDAQDGAEALESIKAKVNVIRKTLLKQGPCHTDLHAALDIIAESQQTLGERFTTFYLPNCDKHGFYIAKQCETSLIGKSPRCWCVSSWNGMRIPGTGDLTSDEQCHQEVTP